MKRCELCGNFYNSGLKRCPRYHNSPRADATPEQLQQDREELQQERERLERDSYARRFGNLALVSRNFPVTTVDLKENYDVVGPIYFQISNKGLFSSAFGQLKVQYAELLEIRRRETPAGPRIGDDWSVLVGEGSVGQNDFDSAFYIAVQELKKRAASVGADAIVGLRQDIDLDTSGFQYFYLQMYGTAVKLYR